MTDFNRTTSTQFSPLPSGTVPLSALSTGEHGAVVQLSGGRGLLGRMTSLGFTPGAHVTIVQNFGRGPLIVQVRDTRIALGRGEASKVYVQREAVR